MISFYCCRNRKTLPSKDESVRLEATGGFEPPHQSFADSCLTTWLCRRVNADYYIIIKLRCQEKFIQPVNYIILKGKI